MRKNILIAGLLATAALAVAVPQNFARRSFGIKAGVVVLESMRTAGFPANYAPHVFGNFDANVRIKPARLSLYNPAPESIWTAAARTRWTALAGSAPAIGERTSKRDAVYWEVSLSAASDRQISNYDILLVPAFGLVQLNSAEREKLRRFCDKGGVLWVDTNGSTTFDVVNNFPVPFTLNAPFGSASVDFQHPLMSFPHALSPADLIQMEGQPGTRGISAAIVPGAIEPIEATIAPDFMRFQTVVEDPLGPTISVARLGDGYMVVTTRAVSKSLNHDPNLGINSNVGAVATTPLFDRASDSAAKFLLNMVYLTSGFAQSGGGSHRSSSSPIDLEPPLQIGRAHV